MDPDGRLHLLVEADDVMSLRLLPQIHYLRLTTAILHHEKSRKYLLSNVLYPSHTCGIIYHTNDFWYFVYAEHLHCI